MILEFPNAITYIGGALCGLSNLMKKQLESSRGLCGLTHASRVTSRERLKWGRTKTARENTPSLGEREGIREISGPYWLVLKRCAVGVNWEGDKGGLTVFCSWGDKLVGALRNEFLFKHLSRRFRRDSISSHPIIMVFHIWLIHTKPSRRFPEYFGIFKNLK